jgi:hypothetical protein
VVAAEIMCRCEGLDEGEIWRGGGVDLYRRCTGSRENLSRCDGKGKYIRNMRYVVLARKMSGVGRHMPSSIVCVVRYCLDLEYISKRVEQAACIFYEVLTILTDPYQKSQDVEELNYGERDI